MDGLVAGDVVLVNFPFSDHRRAKERPSLVLGRTAYGGYLVGYISTRNKHLGYAVEVNASDLVEGKLSKTSYIRAEISFVVDAELVQKKLARVSQEIHERVLESLNAYLRSECDYRLSQEAE